MTVRGGEDRRKGGARMSHGTSDEQLGSGPSLTHVHREVIHFDLDGRWYGCGRMSGDVGIPG